MTRVSIVIAVVHPDHSRTLDDALKSDTTVAVVGRAKNLMETFACVEETSPTLVVIDAVLTKAPEFEVMRALFASLDIRWLVFGATAPDNKGKSDLFGLDEHCPPRTILSHIHSVARASKSAQRATPTGGRTGRDFGNSIVLIGASTGGVEALSKVLSHFPDDCPPTVIVQHTGRGFGHSLIRLLQRQTSATVLRAQDGDPLTRGTIAVGAGVDEHIRIATSGPLRIQTRSGPTISGHIPSVDALFDSARPIAPRCVAALLTGMGRDGAQGMMALARSGCHTIAQDRGTSVVWGMPRAAVELGAVAQQLPINDIGPAILKAAARQGAHNPTGRLHA